MPRRFSIKVLCNKGERHGYALNGISKEYQKLNPDTNIILTTVETDDLHKTASDELPNKSDKYDIIEDYIGFSNYFIENDCVEPLDDYISVSGDSRIFNNMFDAFLRQSMYPNTTFDQSLAKLSPQSFH